MMRPAARALIAALVITPPLALLLYLSGAVGALTAAAALLAFAFVTLLAGLLLLRAMHAADMPLPAAWGLGVFATAIAVYALCATLGWTAAYAFALWTLGVALAALYWRSALLPRRLGAAELAGLLACGIATLVWCRHIAGTAQRAAEGGALLAYVDFLLHGATIAHLGDPLAVGRGSIDLAGLPPPLYHYASFALAAVFAAPLDAPGLVLSTAVWLPLGFVTLCAGAYVLGDALAGPAGGAAALAALALLPDPGSYGLHSFHWGIVSAPGSTYAVGFCLLALAFLRRWRPGGPRPPLVTAAALVAGTALVRMHVFALAAPAVFASAALAIPAVKRRTLAFMAVGIGAVVAFAFAFYALVPDAVPALGTMFDLMFGDFMGPTAYGLNYPRLAALYGDGVALPAGLLLWLGACLGLLAVLYPLSEWLVRRAHGPRPLETEPVAFLACYVLLLLAAPTPLHGDSTELTERPFVLLYAVFAVWTAANLVRAFPAQWREVGRRGWPALVVAAALALIWPHARALGSEPRFKWGWEQYARHLAPGLPQAAAYLRRAARPGDVFATSAVTLRWTSTDDATDLVALAGVPAYFSRGSLQVGMGGSRERAARERYSALKDVEREADPGAALRRLRALGIQWYVVTSGDGPRWDRGRGRAAFVADRVAVYATGERK